MIFVSPKYTVDHFSRPWSTDHKIEIFRDRTEGFMLDIADQMINGRRDDHGNEVFPQIANSGFAVLQVLLCYFEMIAKYEDGYVKEDCSRLYFKKGVESVFPEMTKHPEFDKHAKWLYKHARNGLYHNGATGSRVIISGTFPDSILIREDDLVINPHSLAPSIKAHLKEYVERLNDQKNVEMRSKFEMRFDTDVED